MVGPVRGVPERVPVCEQQVEARITRRIGIETAQELAVALPAMAQGIYLMPPFGNHAIAEAVIDALPK